VIVFCVELLWQPSGSAPSRCQVTWPASTGSDEVRGQSAAVRGTVRCGCPMGVWWPRQACPIVLPPACQLAAPGSSKVLLRVPSNARGQGGRGCPAARAQAAGQCQLYPAVKFPASSAGRSKQPDTASLTAGAGPAATSSSCHGVAVCVLYTSTVIPCPNLRRRKGQVSDFYP
jgi:hypothetical protein